MHHLPLSSVYLETGSVSHQELMFELLGEQVDAALSKQTPLHELIVIADAANTQRALVTR